MKSAGRSNKMKMSKHSGSCIEMVYVLFMILMVFVKCNECLIIKRSASPELNSDSIDSNVDKLNVNYDEYPVSMIPFK